MQDVYGNTLQVGDLVSYVDRAYGGVIIPAYVCGFTSNRVKIIHQHCFKGRSSAVNNSNVIKLDKHPDTTLLTNLKRKLDKYLEEGF